MGECLTPILTISGSSERSRFCQRRQEGPWGRAGTGHPDTMGIGSMATVRGTRLGPPWQCHCASHGVQHKGRWVATACPCPLTQLQGFGGIVACAWVSEEGTSQCLSQSCTMGAALFSICAIHTVPVHGIPGMEHHLWATSSSRALRLGAPGWAGRWPEELSGDPKPFPIIQCLSSNVPLEVPLRGCERREGCACARSTHTAPAAPHAPHSDNWRCVLLDVLPCMLMPLPLGLAAAVPGSLLPSGYGDLAATTVGAYRGTRPVPSHQPCDGARNVFGIKGSQEPPLPCSGQLHSGLLV